MKLGRCFWLGTLLCALPYIFCFLTNRTFAPMDALHSTILPYAADQKYSAPDNHFWSDTVTFYWPRYQTIARHEFPISFSSGGGGPNYADTISGFFSPYCLFVFTILPASIHSLDILWLLQFLVFYVGLFLWFVSIGASPLSALLGAITQCYCTAFFPGSYSAFQTLGALSFLPWALWAESKFVQKHQAMCIAAIFLALSIFSGNIQTALYPMLVFCIWGALQKKWADTFYTLALAVLLTLPMWLPGIQYHIFLGVQNIASRRSQVPIDFGGRIKALFALPTILLPALYGSSKSIDFLKVFQTSATYFLGSIGLLSPVLCFLSWRRESWKNSSNRLAILLLFFSLFVMLTPLLNILYYRVVCLVCFALSILLATQFEQFFEIKQKRILLLLALLLFLLSVFVFFMKIKFHDQIQSLFESKLMAGTYSWNIPLREARIERWFAGYISSPSFFALIGTSILCYYALQLKNRYLLAFVLIVDLSLVWYPQVTFNKAADPTHHAYDLIKNELKKSSSYPASRFLALDCNDGGEFLFPFSVHEYLGVPSIQYYGSTMIRRLPDPSYHCDPHSHLITFPDLKYLQADSLNVLVSRKSWTLSEPSYHLLFENEKYRIWSRASFSAIWSADNLNAMMARSKSWNGWKIEWRVNASVLVNHWSISLPFYPGWHYLLDGTEIKPASIVETIPSFSEKVSPGDHTVVAFFHPVMLYWGLLFSVLTLIFMLWKTILIRD